MIRLSSDPKKNPSEIRNAWPAEGGTVKMRLRISWLSKRHRSIIGDGSFGLRSSRITKSATIALMHSMHPGSSLLFWGP